MKIRKFQLVFGLVFVSIALGSVVGEYDDVWTGRRIFRQPKMFLHQETPMHKALFTQRGYIQFLRWELPVPEIEEFTFCLWVKSTNLTYAHSIFSYSKNEQQRLVSSWISPFGRSVHLAIGGNDIMAYPTNLQEHRWYHICQSWENRIGRYALWINGDKEIEGYVAQLAGHVIPSKGDMVVGQEYTNFDKGFEDGIEGAVVGFNLILESAFDKPKNIRPFIEHGVENFVPFFPPGGNRIPTGFEQIDGTRSTARFDLGSEIHPVKQLRRGVQNDARFSPYSMNSGPEFSGRIHRRRDTNRREVEAVKFLPRTRRGFAGIRRNGEKKPLGLELVDLTYNNCQIGRGSPFIGGSKMLISWTRTPVKVFGGAILKNARKVCGNF